MLVMLQLRQVPVNVPRDKVAVIQQNKHHLSSTLMSSHLNAAATLA